MKKTARYLGVLALVLICFQVVGAVPVYAMEQVLFGGSGGQPLSAADTKYNSVIGGFTWSAADSDVYKVVSADGVIKYLRVKLTGAPGVGKKYTFALMVNGAPSALTLEIAGTSTSGDDMVHEIDVAPGDYISIRCVPDGTPTVVKAAWSMVFEGDTAKESLIMNGGANVLSNAATEYAHLMGPYALWTNIENDAREVCPTAGTIKDLYVKLNIDPGNAPDAYRFTVRLNGATVAQSLIVTITADATTGSDLVHNLVVASGDILTMMVEPLNGPAASPVAAYGMTFVADVDGESIVMGGSTQDLDNAATEYNHIINYRNTLWTATESNRWIIGQPSAMKNLYILLSGSPDAGNKYTFTLRIDGADSNVVAEVSNAATTANSGVLEDATIGGYVTLQVVPDSTPTVRDAYWGFVSFMEAATPPVNIACDSDAVFSRTQDGWVNVTVSDPNGVGNLDTVDIQVNTTLDYQNFTLRWTQATNVFSELSDPDNICTLNTTRSIRNNLNATTDQICFCFAITGGTDGACDVRLTTTDDDANTDIDTYASEFTYNTYGWDPIGDLINSAFSYFGILNYMSDAIAYVTGISTHFTGSIASMITLITQQFRIITNVFTWFMRWVTRFTDMILTMAGIITGLFDGTGAVVTYLGNWWTYIDLASWYPLVTLLGVLMWVDSIIKRGRTQGEIQVAIRDLQTIMSILSYFTSMFTLVINTVVDTTFRLFDAIA